MARSAAAAVVAAATTAQTAEDLMFAMRAKRECNALLLDWRVNLVFGESLLFVCLHVNVHKNVCENVCTYTFVCMLLYDSCFAMYRLMDK